MLIIPNDGWCREILLRSGPEAARRQIKLDTGLVIQSAFHYHTVEGCCVIGRLPQTNQISPHIQVGIK